MLKTTWRHSRKRWSIIEMIDIVVVSSVIFVHHRHHRYHHPSHLHVRQVSFQLRLYQLHIASLIYHRQHHHDQRSSPSSHASLSIGIENMANNSGGGSRDISNSILDLFPSNFTCLTLQATEVQAFPLETSLGGTDAPMGQPGMQS